MTPLTDEEIWSLCKLGYRLASHGRDGDAADLFRGLVALDERLAYPWHALGVLARRRGDLERAVDCFHRRLDLEPHASTSRLSLAETLWEHGYHRDAAETLRYFRHHTDVDSPTARRARILLERWEPLV